MKISSYPSIYNLGHSALDELFLDDVIVQEKVDGSQFSFASVDGKIVCRSKGKDQSPGQTDSLFERAVATVGQLTLRPEWVYRGEYLQKPKHNTLAYDRIPKQHIVLFDITVGQERYLPYDRMYEEAERIGLEVVPILTSGLITNWESLKQLLDTPSFLGGTNIEGMVIKNYKRYGPDKKVLMGKFVSEAFKERHVGEWRSANPHKADIIDALAELFRTDARWVKAIQHLRDNGELQNSPQDIGPLLKEINIDVLKEEEDVIKDTLFKYAWPQISRKITRGFPEFYKEYLANNAFKI